MYADDLLRPWHEAVLELVPDIELFDAHTHTGSHDPDGMSCTAEQLADGLELAGARAVVFTMQEPDGYREANDRVVAEAEASDGRLVPFCRLDPADDPVAEAERALDRGARGIKLHPRAEHFRLDDERLEPVFALADDRGLPVITHAGRGIPALGRDALEITERHPGARLDPVVPQRLPGGAGGGPGARDRRRPARADTRGGAAAGPGPGAWRWPPGRRPRAEAGPRVPDDGHGPDDDRRSSPGLH